MSPVLLNPYRFGSAQAGFKTITIDHTQVGASDSTNFPMMFTLTLANLKSVANGGQVGNVNDISFATTSGGAVDLVWDNAILDVTTGFFTATVKIPTLSHASDTVIFLRWDNTNRGSTQQGTFGAAYDANFVAIYHNSSDGSTTNGNDATSNGHTVAATSLTAALGDYRGVCTYNGTNSKWHNGSFPSLNSTWTIMVRLKPDATGSGFRTVVSSGIISLRAWDVQLDASTKGQSAFSQGSGNFKSAAGATALSTSAYSTLHGWWDGTTQRIYLNGASDGTLSVSGSSDTSAIMEIGALNASTFFKGSIGEVRISNIARSADWLTAEHNNFNAPGTFYSVT